jgi:hypothetical protein
VTDEELTTWVREQLPTYDRVALERVKAGDRVWQLTRSGDGATARVEITDHLIVLGPLEQRLREARPFMELIGAGELRGVRLTRNEGVVEWAPE